MHVDIVLFSLLLVIGCAAFFFGAIYLLGQVIGRIIACAGRFVARPFGRHAPAGSGCCAAMAPKPLVCPRQSCRKVERRTARFCSQCGTPLMVQPNS